MLYLIFTPLCHFSSSKNFFMLPLYFIITVLQITLYKIQYTSLLIWNKCNHQYYSKTL